MRFLHKCLNTRCLRISLLLLLDILIITLSSFASFWLRIDLFEHTPSSIFDNRYVLELLPWLIGLRLLCNRLFNLYNWSFSQARFNEGMRLAASVLLGLITFVFFGHIIRVFSLPPPRSIYVLEAALTFVGMFILRFLPGYFLLISAQRLQHRVAENNNALRTAIYGSNNVAEVLARELSQTHGHNCAVIGFIDDNPAHFKSSIGGIQVLGGMLELTSIIEHSRIEQLLLVGDDISGQAMRSLVDICGPRGVRLKSVPAYRNVLHSSALAHFLKDIDPENLLDRQPVNFDSVNMKGFFSGKVVMVTGAGGTIGGELCRQIMAHGIKQLLLFDINENALFFLEMELQEHFPDCRVVLLLGSIQDKPRLDEVMALYHPDIVFHAAAHKHVPILETAPKEAIKNNVLGTFNVAESACTHDVRHFVLISTDKAVSKANALGASKRIAELLVKSLNTKKKTKYQIVRFGNVLDSNGSLVEIVRKQISKGGPITITHPDMERYFMTIREAVGLVLVAAAIGEGEINVLDMGPSIKVEALVRQMVYLSGLIPDRDIEIRYTEPRAGELLREALYDPNDELRCSSFPKIKIICDHRQLDVDAIVATASQISTTVTDDNAAAWNFLFADC